MLSRTSMSSKLFLVVALLMFCALITQSSSSVLLSSSEEELRMEALEEKMTALEEKMTEMQKTLYELISTLLDDKSDGERGKEHVVEKRDLSHSNATGEFEHSDEFLRLSIHGLSGLRGPPGRDGRDGKDGAPGATGAAGPPGSNGRDGVAGPPGENGSSGATGRDGRDGAAGEDGAPGATGCDGEDGAAGPPGENGAAGAPGTVGPPGEDGEDGAAGPPGEDGAPGATGAAGPPGADGLPGAPGEGGDVYTRWGRKTCGNHSTLLYEGFAGGSQFNQPGGGVNYQCMPLSPEHSDRQYGSGPSAFSYIAGAEYVGFEHGLFPSGTKDQNVPCARCYTNDRAAVMMLPGKRTCPNEWTKEYEGFLMAEYFSSNHQSTFECMDADPERIVDAEANTNGAVFYFVRPRCGSGDASTHHCPPYDAVREITCVVCSK